MPPGVFLQADCITYETGSEQIRYSLFTARFDGNQKIIDESDIKMSFQTNTGSNPFPEDSGAFTKPGFKKPSALFGAVLTIAAFISVLMLFARLDDILLAAVGMVASGYFLVGAAVFWTLKLYKDGLTINELWVVAGWPLKVRQVLAANTLEEGIKSLALDDDGSDDVIDDEGDALIFGLVYTTVVALFFVPLFIVSVISAGSQAIAVIILAQIIGAAVYFWTMGFHKRDLSAKMMVELALWELDMLKDLWKRVTLIRNMWRNRKADRNTTA